MRNRRKHQRRFDYADPCTSRHLTRTEVIFMILLVAVVSTVPFLL